MNARDQQAANTDAIRILLVEDSPSDADILQGTLRQTHAGNFQFSWVERLEDGLARLRQEPFDVLLLDLNLPDSSGPETFRRAQKAAPRMPIVVLTGANDESLGLAAVQEGVQDYLAKGEADGRQIARAIRYAIERKRAEEQLATSESRLRALLESAPQGVIAVDERGCIILLNAQTEELFGYSRDELLGQSLEAVLPERYRAAHPEYLRQYFAHPYKRVMGLGLDLWGRKKDGSEFPVEISLSSVEHGGTPWALALIMDITERKRAEEQLRQAQKLEGIGMLAGGIAHDFNNLLVGVMGNASLAQDMLPPENPASELLGAIVTSGQQAAHLTRQMLAYAGKGQFLVEPVHLSDLLPEMSGFVQPSISKKIALHLDLDSDLPHIEADRSQMQQVFMNLVLNAAEAIGSNAGLISVKTRMQEVGDQYLRSHLEAAGLQPGKYVCLEVCDTGCGMDEATKARIFEPFFSTKFQGRGLGLAAVAGIVRGHKGAIAVTSECGKGSCLTVLFPAAESVAAVSTIADHDATLHGTGTILVVDDEKTVRELAKKALERYGYKVLEVDNGLAAIDVFKRYPGDIALVLLDTSMPGMSGQETAPELRKIRPAVRLLVSSGYSEAETMRSFPGHASFGFLQKPYTSRQIAQKVKSILG